MLEKIEKGKDRRRRCSRRNVCRETREENVKYWLIEMFYVLKEVQCRTVEEEHVKEEERKFGKGR